MGVGDSSDQLRLVALAHFARDGFAGASLQRIAVDAGLSKSSVLYHFDSKESLFEAALRPAVDRFRRLVDDVAARGGEPSREALLDAFTDFVLGNRDAVQIIAGQSRALEDVPVIAEVDRLIRRLARLLPADGAPGEPDVRDVRLGFAIAGAAHVVASESRSTGPADAVRDVLRSLLGAVLVPPLYGAGLDGAGLDGAGLAEPAGVARLARAS